MRWHCAHCIRKKTGGLVFCSLCQISSDNETKISRKSAAMGRITDDMSSNQGLWNENSLISIKVEEFSSKRTLLPNLVDARRIHSNNFLKRFIKQPR